MNKNILLIFIFIFFNVSSQKYNIELYNTDNGLPQNSVKDIIKDKYGFIWLTTENGIVRYDGSQFLVYKSFPLNSQRFTYFYGHTEKDSIFTPGDYGRIILLHKKIPKVTSSAKRFPTLVSKDHINYLLYCSNYSYTNYSGINFYMNFKEGKYYIRKNTLTFSNTHSQTEETLKIKAIYKNVPRVFTINEMLFYINFTTKKVERIEKGKIVNSYEVPLLTDINSKILWSRINNQVFILNKNIFYMCTYEKEHFRISKIVQINQIKNDNLISIYYDKLYKKLYLGSSTEGLQIISLANFITVKGPLPKLESVFYATLPYDSSSVINPYGEIYTRNGMISTKNFKNTVPFFMAYDHYRNIMVRKDDDLKTYQKTTSYSSYTYVKNFFLKDFFFDETRYYSLVAQRKNNGTPEFGGTFDIYKDKSFKSLKKRFLFNDEPTKFMQLDQDHILVGTIKGLYNVQIEINKIHNITADKELSIRNIIRSKDGNIWITTLGKGFYLMRNNRLIKMPFDASGNISSSHTILEDMRGFFWIPTNNGLYRVLESQLLKYVQNKDSKVNYYRFSKDSGFNTNEFNGGSNICGNQLDNGDFVIPSLNGLVFFDPLKIPSYYPENIYIERALIDHKEKYFKNELHLEQKSSRIDLFIDIPYYANPDNITVQAKIMGLQNAKWESIGKDRKFSISNLGYGNYSFIVKMLVSDNGKYIYKKINLIIQPYFYQTIWFKILTISLLLFLLYLLVKWRINFLQKKNLELEEIINIRTQKLSSTVEKLETTKIQLHKEIEQQKKLIGTITHDITTPVKFIALTAKEVLENKEFNQQRSEKVLASIYKSSDQLYNFTATLKEYADIYSHHRSDKTEVYSLCVLIEEKKVLFNAIAESNNTSIINNIDEEIHTQISKNIVAAIIHNLLDNSVKYTKNGTIVLEAHLENENIIIMISDTGVGMDPQKIEYYTRLQDNIENEKLLLQKYGMGLHLVLQLLQMIESKMIFKRNDTGGTTCQLILKNKIND
ncbi:ATP-binding protein [Chryseobacterium sp. T16E-39]|uniref:ligand-binding sensor domain-containing protein n=1 Tax=Chryseobacterium sp. T16E-39 TaxID=2015076 RepID=UPI000B5B3A69|nr:HAMP domain-containing sensor histidine kinase [Chryseobacterium sp. T16E-39]ASK28859.1 ATP-binding protein [Chryseobacterium sp. T16E-39]